MFKHLIPLATLAFVTLMAHAQQSVTSLTLINADNDQPIAGFDPLANGATLDLGTLPTRNLNISANTSPVQVGSVRFGFDGNANFHTETNPPYALHLDDAGDFRPWTPSVGSHTITATPYTGGGASGTAGTPITISFTVTDNGGGGGGGGGGGTGAWQESGGIVVIEPEHGDLVSSWVARPTTHTADPTMAGSLGDGWLEWTGPQYFGNTIGNGSANGVLTYTFEITTPGEYIFRWRGKQYNDVASGDAGNDSFMRFASGTTPGGFEDFGSFTKVWVQSRTNWSWATNFEPQHGVFFNGDRARRNYTAGTHSIQLAARSPGHSIDRIVLHRSNIGFNESNFNNFPESDRDGGGGGGSTLVYDATTDFPAIGAGEVPYYVDAARNALAINASVVAYRDKFARATTTFDGAAGRYDVTITALGEVDGECSYRLLVNGTLIGTKQNVRVATDYGAQNHIFRGVNVPAGATLAVESNNVSNGLIPEGDAFAFARGRWTTLTLSESTSTGVPEADAGADKVIELPTSSTIINGSGTDDDGTITSYAWAQLSGPNAAALSGVNTANLTASGLVVGTYNFQLTVTDNENQTDTDDVFVSVIEEGGVPVLISGETKRWHDVTLTLDGPSTSEGASPNPFYNYQFDVIFTHPGSGLTYRVPGYYAADGNAGNTSASSGNKWRAHLSPDEIGTWNYQIVFRQGTNASINGPDSGSPVSPYNGVTGTFEITENDKAAPDFRAQGRLQYVNKHHLRFKGDGSYFIKAGADSPENLLAYDDIDNTSNSGGRRKSWSPHQQDYVAGDPTWAGGKGSELIGAVNYIANKGLNVMSFLTYSYNGDDKNVFPHRTAGDYSRMDCSKLDQWGIVFAHMQEKGIYLHFKTQETENDQNFDGGALGNQRKLYYRELVARYGHHLALNWNLGEENTNSSAQAKDFAQWFYDNDPYRHHVVIHTYPNQKDLIYNPLLGNASKITGASLQSDKWSVFSDTKNWRNKSAGTPRPWVCANDEQGPANEGIKADSNDAAHNIERGNVLWGNIMAGGAGIECYFGYQQPENDLNLQNFRSRDLWWDQCAHALRFIYDNDVPFWNMLNADNLVSGAGNNGNHCLAQNGNAYVVYLRNGGSHTLDLSGVAGVFSVKWFDPRNGGALINGPTVGGGGTVSLGAPPASTSSDWVALISTNTGGGGTNTAPFVFAGDDTTAALENGSAEVALSGSAFDDGLPVDSIVAASWVVVSGPSAVDIANDTSAATSATFTALGEYVLRLSATDGELSASDEVTITIEPPSNDVSFNPTHDVYIENGNPLNNGDLRVESSGRTRLAYLLFDLQSLPAGDSASAVFKLTESTDVSSGAMTIRVFAGASSNWTEASITGANAPAKGTELGSYTGEIANDQEIEFELAPFITGPGTYTLIVEADSSNLDVAFASSEGAAAPELLVSLPNEPPIFEDYHTATTVSGSLQIPYADILALASDPDGDPLSLIEVSENTANGGDVLMGGGVVIFNAPVGYVGTDTFELTVTDGNGGNASANLTVNIVESDSAIAGAPIVMNHGNSGEHDFDFDGVPNLEYQLQRSLDMENWESIATVKADASGHVDFTDPDPPADYAYYRVAVP